MEDEKRQKTIVVGAGPVGALAALYAAGRGDEVEIYELRGDLRDPSTTPLNFTKSINLALSERGVNSFRNAQCPGLLEAVLAETIPMHGRMIHGEKNGQIFEQSQAYDVHGRYIRAVDRAQLNKRMLDELDKMPNVTFYFNHKLVGADFKRRVAWFERRSNPDQSHAQNPTGSDPPKGKTDEIKVPFDFMIGADGAHSAVRYHLQKYTRMNYQQEYIDTLWCEFHISPAAVEGPNGLFKISKNHLHIWPAGEFMFIAIPSLDNTFTSTLFLPASRFAELDANPDTLVPFFKKYFPGVVPDLISEDDIEKQYNENPHLPLISIKCTPYHYDSCVVILGDAAHAMVPFYGQGMNAGLEDVRVLYDLLDKHSTSVSLEEKRIGRLEALAAYSKQRTPDAYAINDLALRNYQEMRSDVRSPLYKLRKWIEERLSVSWPSLGVATQYSRVSFGNQRYSEVEKSVQRQGRLLVAALGSVPAVATIAAGVFWWWRWRRAAGSSRVVVKWAMWMGKKFEEIGRRYA